MALYLSQGGCDGLARLQVRRQGLENGCLQLPPLGHEDEVYRWTGLQLAGKLAQEDRLLHARPRSSKNRRCPAIS